MKLNSTISLKLIFVKISPQKVCPIKLIIGLKRKDTLGPRLKKVSELNLDIEIIC